MTFQHPNALPYLNNSGLDVDTGDHSSKIIGDEAINTAVNETIPAYDKTLHFGLKTSAKERHERLGGLAFGKIQHDIARLHGLAEAIGHLSTVVSSGKDQLAHDWKGESYDAFRTNIENVEKTLNDYQTAVRTTADGLKTALDGIRSGYQAYHDDCLGKHFTFKSSGLPLPDQWWRMSEDSPEYLAEHCTCSAIDDCRYNDDEYAGMIVGRMTNNWIFNEKLEKTDCYLSGDYVAKQYDWAVKTAHGQIGQIHQKIDSYCNAADALHDQVTKAYDASLENLRILAEASVFSNLVVPGASAGGGEPAPGGDPEPGPGGGGPGPGGGYPGGGGGSDAAIPQPGPQPAQVDPATAPEPTDPAATDPATDPAADPAKGEQPAAQESVTIKDGDKSISVTSPDGEGHVKVTVEGPDGKPKSYDLDFDAASGMEPRPGAEGEKPAAGADAAEKVPAGTNGQCVIKDGDLTITAERPLFDPGTIKLEVDDGVNDPTTYTVDFDEQPGDADKPADQPADAKDGDAPADADHAKNGKSVPSGGAQPADPDAATDADSAPDKEKPAEKEQLTTPQAVLPGDDAASLQSQEAARAHEAHQEHREAVVPGQASGEAELASASDGAPGNQAGGGGMPMMGGMGAGSSGSGDGGRAGTGWSVHGDLFDNHDPVYSMHGVLGEDDLEGR
jgi:uncharacterized protein YukE